jgi:hypothetical protein
MAHTREYTEIAGVTVKVADGTRGGGIVGDSQTVNVYDESNTEGNYRQVYRSRDRDRWVRADQLRRNIRSLEQLDSYLARRGFQREGHRVRR